ncbi:helix-hairpin-helix domain-containing protein [Paraflavisolibacter sp. H34]|uniref:ComEA family DNA-binding protein n=1 Tax=Huijunlia imazamoxiresistens TaxID=3127457 RepID=UPI00301733B7
MNRPLFLAVLFLLLCLCFYGRGQEVEGRVKQQLENWAERTGEAAEDDYLLQQLAYLRKNPLELNTATADELQVMPFLTAVQIGQFLQYRKMLGNLISIYELQAVPGWDLPTIQQLLPYCTVRPPAGDGGLGARLAAGEHSLLWRYVRRFDGAPADTSLAGSAGRLLLRYRYQQGPLLQYGVTAEKDPGEALWRRGRAGGVDFYSAHLFVRRLGIVKALALGDFTVNLGQGLLHWQSLAFKKSADVLSVKRQSPVLRPYSSPGELLFHRGAGLTVQKGRWEGTAFASLRRLDASVRVDPSAGEEAFAGFHTSGLHRTATELSAKGRVRQATLGGSLRYAAPFFRIGLNAVHYRFSHLLQRQEAPFDAFAPTGRSWSNAGLDYSFSYGNLYLFGEAAVDPSLHAAFLNGALISLDPKADLALVHRRIAKEYGALYGNAFTENTAPANESGLYTGLRLRPWSGVVVDAYADVYRFPWLRYRAGAPGGGRDYLVQLTVSGAKGVEGYSRYRHERKDINEAGDGRVLPLVQQKARQDWRLHLAYPLTTAVSLRLRTDMVWYDRLGVNAEEGFQWFLEGHWSGFHKFGGNLRLQYFDSDGYNSRLYVYENDVLFGYSVPSVYDRGYRYYANVRYRWKQQVSVWLRWAQTVKERKEEGARLPAEAGPAGMQEIKVQLLLTF